VGKGDLAAPDLIRSKGHLLKESDRYLLTLENKLASYYLHMVNYGSPKMGAKERRQLFRHLPTNSPGRIASELVSFLQSTVLKVTNGQAELLRASNPDGELVNFSAVKLLASTTLLLGTLKFVTDSVKEFLRTGELDLDDSEKNIKRMGEALLTSGAMGIGVDFMSQVVSPFRDGPSGARMPNPILEHLTQAVKAGIDPSEKKFQRLLKRSTPGQNLFFIDNEFRRNLVEFGVVHESLNFLDE